MKLNKSLIWLTLLCVAVFAQEANPFAVEPNPVQGLEPASVAPLFFAASSEASGLVTFPSAPKGWKLKSKGLKIGISAGLMAGGLAAIAYGIAQNSNVVDAVDKCNRKAAEDAEGSRNIGYGIGAALFAAGLGVVIFF